MSDATSEHERLPRRPRIISRFICQELLFDYYCDRLDEERKSAVQTYIKSHPEIQDEIEQIKTATDYCQKLSLTRVTPNYLSQLKEAKTLPQKVRQNLNWRKWPESLRWTFEALTVSVLIAVIAIATPWQKLEVLQILQQKSYEIFVSKNKTDPAEKIDLPKVVDAKVETNEVAIETVKEEEKNKIIDSSQKTLVVAADKPEAVKLVKPSKPVEVALVKKPMGRLYRFMMAAKNSESVSTKTIEKIRQLGGAKAGQVDLGWKKKNPDGYYFHFEMPKANYNELVKTLGGYGPVRIYDNPHERVMPEGQIRIILWIEEKAPEVRQNIKVESAIENSTPQPKGDSESDANTENSETLTPSSISDEATKEAPAE